MSLLALAAVFLAAAAFFAPLARRLGISSVLGYLIAGVLAGPSGLRLVYSGGEVESILHAAEFGVVLLLFVIGLELRPQRLWTLRADILGAGGIQVAVTALIVGGLCSAFGFSPLESTVIGSALALSSTALALQLLEERGQLKKRHGRMAFAVLLFQDVAAIPMIALVPLIVAAEGGGPSLSLIAMGRALAAIFVILVLGRYVLRYVYRFIAATGVREGMTAAALLTVVVVALLMELVGLSAALGAFLAGILIGDSEYRHELEANIEPFERILLGVFFTAVGMGLDLTLLGAQPGRILAIVVGLMAIKLMVLTVIGRTRGLDWSGAAMMGAMLAQGGEFAFVLFSVAGQSGALDANLERTLVLAVTLSLALTPPLVWLVGLMTGIMARTPEREADTPPEQRAHVIIAGFGRFGQIPGRILNAKGIPFTALDKSADHVDFVRRFGNKIFYGDATRSALLEAAQAREAQAFVLAIDDVEDSIKTARMVRSTFPKLPVYARARNRQHAYDLMELGVEVIYRETLLSALALTEDLLVGLGENRADARRSVQMFRDFDEARLKADLEIHGDDAQIRASAQRWAAELERMFIEDRKDQAERAT